MITAEQSMQTAADYADDALHYRAIGSPLLMRTCWLGLCICEAATMSATHGREFALDTVNRMVGGEHERDIWRTRGPV